MKRKEVGEALIERVDYPNKGRFRLPETGEKGIVKNVIPGQKFRSVSIKNTKRPFSEIVWKYLKNPLLRRGSRSVISLENAEAACTRPFRMRHS